MLVDVVMKIDVVMKFKAIMNKRREADRELLVLMAHPNVTAEQLVQAKRRVWLRLPH